MQSPADSDGDRADGAGTMPPAVRSYLESRSLDLKSMADRLDSKGDDRESKPFGPSGPPKELQIRQPIDLQRQTISRSELIDLLSLACKDDHHPFIFFLWADGSMTRTQGDPSEQLQNFHQMESLRFLSGNFSYPDGSRLSIRLDRWQQALESRADTHNSHAERRLYELRTLASDWNGRSLSTGSGRRRILRGLVLGFAIFMVGFASYAFAVSQGLPRPSESLGGGAIGLIWTGISGLLGGWLAGRANRKRDRTFVMRHPERRQLSHDQIQSWATVIGVLVAMVFGVLAVVLKP